MSNSLTQQACITRSVNITLVFNAVPSCCREALLTEFPGKLWLDVLSKADLLEADFQAADAARLHQSEGGEESSQATSQSADHSHSWQDETTQAQIAQRRAHSNNSVSSTADPEATEQLACAEDHAVHLDAEQHAPQAVQSSPGLQHQEASSQIVTDAAETTLAVNTQAPGYDVLAMSQQTNTSVNQRPLSVAAQAALTLPNPIRISSVTQFGIQDLQQHVTKLLAEDLEVRMQSS